MTNSPLIDQFEIRRNASELRAQEMQRLTGLALAWFKSKVALPSMKLDVA